MSLRDWTKISPVLPILQRSPRIFFYVLMLPVRNIWTDRFLRLFLVFYDIKLKRISNRRISCDVCIRSECGSCPADVATAARPRMATHDHGRFYSFINKISFHGSRRFIFTGSCSVCGNYPGRSRVIQLVLHKSACLSVGVRKRQVAIIARSSREMSLTDRIVLKYILSRVRVSVRPSNCFIREKQ